ncbi:MAG: AAA family ATPase [Thermodesulfobacteriota bacterium]
MDYERFFDLKSTPFRQAPDPAVYFPSNSQEDALIELANALEAGSAPILLTAESGAGKTLLLKMLAQRLADDAALSLIFNPRLTPEELLLLILSQMGQAEPEDRSLEGLRRSLLSVFQAQLRQGLKPVIAVDDAQDLPPDALAEIRNLLEMEDANGRLAWVVLASSMDMAGPMTGHGLKPLGPARLIDIQPFTQSESVLYIRHRIKAAGGGEAARFSPQVAVEIHKTSGGRPGLINALCERAMMAAFLDRKGLVAKSHLAQAIKSLSGESAFELKRRQSPAIAFFFTWRTTLVAAGAVLAILAAIWLVPRIEKPVIPAPPAAIKKADPKTGLGKGLTARSGLSPRAAPAVELTRPRETASTPAPPEPAGPVWPSETAILPAGYYLVVLDRNTEKGQLWLGQENTPLLKAEFKWPSPPAEGLLVLTRNGAGKPYLFTHPASNQAKPKPPADLPQEFMASLTTAAAPVLSLSSGRTLDQTGSEQLREIRSLLETWSAAWRAKDLDKFLGHYGDVLVSHNEGRPAVTYSKAQFAAVMKQIFQRGAFNLTMSEPTLALDPGRPDQAAAVFQQKFVSPAYQDHGTVVLFFKKAPATSGPGAWKISAKYFAPAAANTVPAKPAG